MRAGDAPRPRFFPARFAATGSSMNPSLFNAGGLPAGIAAFCIWGSLVIYWKQLEAVPALEILLYRVVFSLVVLWPLAWGSRRLDELRHALSTPGLRLRLACSAALVSCNWGLYIWAVTSGRITESSLGYYINPLTNVLAGALFCRERPSGLQWLAVGIAAAGVGWSLLAYGEFPWVALTLAGTFTAYGVLRKKVAVGALAGLLAETIFLAPPALAVLIWLHMRGEGHFLTVSLPEMALIMGAGIVTTAPLLLFTYAARHMPLSTLGLIQYLSPTLALCIGVGLYHEPVSRATLITFACIWAALALYSWSLWQRHRQADALREKARTPQRRGTNEEDLP